MPLLLLLALVVVGGVCVSVLRGCLVGWVVV